MQVATPCPAHALDLQLVIAPRLVERDIDTKLELLTRLGHKPDRLSPATKHYCLDRRAFVLDGEIPVSGGRLREVGDFAAHPDPRKTALQQLSHAAIELGHRPNRIGGGFGGRPAFIHGVFSLLSTEEIKLSNQ